MVTICDYDLRWPLAFEDERRAIIRAIGEYTAAVEHIDSTATPGLAAKPTIDIMVGLRQLADAQQCMQPLENLGYEYVPEYEAEIPERGYFRKGRGTSARRTPRPKRRSSAESKPLPGRIPK